MLVAFLRWTVALAMPVLIDLGSARIMVNNWYPSFEYAKPDFPADPYGFTQEERRELATVNIDFLNSALPPAEAVAMIAALRLPGSERPLFDRYELSHMVDVKRLTDTLWVVLLIAAILVIGGLGLLLSARATRPEAYAALFGGGALTTGLLTFLILFVLLSWRTFFITFHDIFFPPGTWTFDFSNSLIRLFPDRFWFDAGVLLVGGALVAGITVMIIGYLLGKQARRPSSGLAARRA